LILAIAPGIDRQASAGCRLFLSIIGHYNDGRFSSGNYPEMALTTALRFNMTNLPDPDQDHSARYQAALEMAIYADQHGLSIVNLEEHHCASNGWLPSPLTMAGAMIGATKNIGVNVTALLVTLYDPIRLAEDIAVLDLLGNGRFNFVAGLGYRPEEYHAVGRDWDKRGQLMDECIDTLLKAWGPEPFEYKGQTLNITPKPKTRPHPFFFIGGMSPAAARRAAKFGLPFYPPMKMPHLEEIYYNEIEKTGKQGFVYYPKSGNAMTFLHENPNEAWDEYGPFFLNETREYSSWKVDNVPRPSEDDPKDIQELKEQGRFEIITPEECTARINDGLDTIVLHPLAGGLPLEHGWKSLKLLTGKVLPAV
jgi:alkanesulfonate monooxygenase SsuD/methylene tetrahydromethanopterin reductase-like flavin-dependent oxidoreductase (luciferase family)